MNRSKIPIEPLDSTTLADQIYERLRNAILDGRLPPNRRIVESELVEGLQASRTPIREALNRLEHEGLLIKSHRGKLYVSDLQVDDLKDLYEVRAVLEGLAAKLSCLNLDRKDLSFLKELVDQMQQAADSGDIEKVTELGTHFHDLLLERCGNLRLQNALESIRSNIIRYRLISASLPGRAHESVRDHRHILRAIEKSDLDEAETLMRKHIMSSQDLLIEKFTEWLSKENENRLSI